MLEIKNNCFKTVFIGNAAEVKALYKCLDRRCRREYKSNGRYVANHYRVFESYPTLNPAKMYGLAIEVSESGTNHFCVIAERQLTQIMFRELAGAEFIPSIISE